MLDFGFQEISAYWLFWITSETFNSAPSDGFSTYVQNTESFTLHTMDWVLQSFLLLFVVERIGRPEMNLRLLDGIGTNVGKVASKYIYLNEKVSFLVYF